MESPSVKATLSRFNGDRAQAIEYCSKIAEAYPHLRAEYLGYLDALRTPQEEALCVHQ